MLGKGHLVFGSQDNPQIFHFFKNQLKTLCHTPGASSFPCSLHYSVLLLPHRRSSWDGHWGKHSRKMKLCKQDTEFEAAKNPPLIISPQFFFSFCVCRVGVVGIRGWLLLAWWREEWWKEEGGIKLLKSIQVQAPTERFNLKAWQASRNKIHHNIQSFQENK